MKTDTDLVVPDTSIWLEYFLDYPLAEQFSALLKSQKKLIVPTITIYEVFKKVLAARDQETAFEAVRIMISCDIIELDDLIAVRAAKFSHDHKIPMADSIIYVSAQKNNATVWTMDSDLKGLPHVQYFGSK